MTTWSMLRKPVLALGILLITASLSACYTLFRHPRLAKLDYRRPDDRRCVSCHSADELLRLVSPVELRLVGAPWDGFYNNPWWFDERHGAGDDSSAVRLERADPHNAPTAKKAAALREGVDEPASP